MATTQYGVNANEAVKLWSRSLWTEVLKDDVVMPLVGTGSNSFIAVQEDTQKSAGDRVRVTLRMLLSGNGVEGDSTLEGNEEALVTHTDDLLINQLRHAVRSDGEMSEQRIHFSIRNEARDGLADWWKDRIATSILNHLGGNTAQADTRFTGHNATLAPTSATGNTRILYGGGTDTTEASLSTNTEAISLTYIDRLLNVAKIATPKIRPARVSGVGRPVYCFIMHPNVTRTLQTNTASGAVTWFNIHSSAMQGGKVSDNSIFTGALGLYKNVILKEDERVPLAPNTTAIRRNVFLGAQAGMMGFGKRYGLRRMSWKEKLFDYDNQLGVKAGMIWGFKKAQYNSIDHGTVVLSTHAAAP